MLQKGKNPTRLDANESALFLRQLEYVKTQTYDVKYKDLKATKLIPVSTEAPSGAEFITFRQFAKIGLAKIVSDYANDFPRADVYGVEKMAKVKSIGDSYGYSVQEIRAAQMAQMSLDQRRAEAARRASDELLNTIAWSGDAETGLLGLTNYPGITEYTIPADGTGGSKAWVGGVKTPDQILRDMNAIVTTVLTTTNGKEIPDTMVMPIAEYEYIRTTRLPYGSDNTILQFFLETNQHIKTVDWLPTELTGIGANSSDRILVYTADPKNITLEIPQPFEQFPPTQKAMEFEVACHQRTGGVIVYYPLAVAFGDLG